MLNNVASIQIQKVATFHSVNSKQIIQILQPIIIENFSRHMIFHIFFYDLKNLFLFKRFLIMISYFPGMLKNQAQRNIILKKQNQKQSIPSFIFREHPFNHIVTVLLKTECKEMRQGFKSCIEIKYSFKVMVSDGCFHGLVSGDLIMIQVFIKYGFLEHSDHIE